MLQGRAQAWTLVLLLPLLANAGISTQKDQVIIPAPRELQCVYGPKEAQFMGKSESQLEAKSHGSTRWYFIPTSAFILTQLAVCPRLTSVHAEGWMNISMRPSQEKVITCTILIKTWYLRMCLQTGDKNQNSLIHV